MEKQDVMNRPFINAVVLLLLILIGVGLYWISRIESPAFNGYLLFHGIVEVFSIVVACAIFMIAWNSRNLLDNHYLLFMGVAFLFVSVLDFVHTLAFKGMAIFPDSGSNPTTQLWIAARYLESLSFLIAPFFIKRKVRPGPAFTVFTVIAGLLLLSIFYWKIFPDCFVEGSGLTVFKKTSEFIISVIILAAILGLIRSRQYFDRGMLRFLILGLAFKIVSEISFTLYVDLYGIPNLIGHYFKIISFYFFYRAIIQIGLQKMEKGDQAGAGEALKPLIPMIQQTMEDVRRMARNLWPSILDDLGILAALSWFTREYEKIYAPITVDRHIGLEEKDVPNDLKIILFRIIQEALNNIAKHSNAPRVYLVLEKTDEILLTIRDQGRGFEVEKTLSGDLSGRGLGLAGMKERAELSGGKFSIHSRPGEGTVIRASWAV